MLDLIPSEADSAHTGLVSARFAEFVSARKERICSEWLRAVHGDAGIPSSETTTEPGEFEGEIEFDSDADDNDELPLNFDPRGKLIEVREGSTLYFSAQFGGDGGGGGNGVTTENREVPLLNTGVIPSASGKARFRIDDHGDRDFRVEIEDVPIGDCSLRVRGTLRGAIRVVTVTGGTEGELEFDSDPDEPHEQPLTFDPRGKRIEVLQGDAVILARDFPS